MGGSCSRSNGKFHNSENERSENRNDEKIEIGSDAILDPDADVELEQGGAGTWTPKAEDFWSTASYDVEEKNFKSKFTKLFTDCLTCKIQCLIFFSQHDPTGTSRVSKSALGSSDFSLFDQPQTSAWGCEGATFSVRNSGYKKTGEKVPSKPPLYEFIGHDLVRAEKRRIRNLVASAPNGWGETLNKKLEQRLGAMRARREKAGFSNLTDLGVPEVLVFNCEIPYQSGGMFSSHPSEDLGFNVISYHVLSDSALLALQRADSEPLPKALDLFKRFVNVGKSERNGISLKTIGSCNNIEDMGLPGFMTSYNGKPVLVTNSLTFRRNPHLCSTKVLELDYDVRMWGYALRQALPGTLFSKLKNAQINIGWLIEGKTEEDLPEQMLACCSSNYLDVKAFSPVEGREEK